MNPHDDVKALGTQAVVMGGGSWGTALAHVLACAGMDVTLIVRNVEQATYINTQHANPRYLQGERLHDAVHAAVEPASALSAARLVVLAVPCQVLRATLQRYRALFLQDAVLVNAAKGIEVSGRVTPYGIVQAECPHLAARYAMLSGPSFALETVRGKPTAVVLGCADERLGSTLREVFATDWFRAYSSTDVLGVELGGAIKNVIALGAGISDGLGFGDNARAALITRGLAEMCRFGAVLGARSETFMGLSGLGDLLLTCAGNLSRNRQVGLRLGGGESLESITTQLGMVAEGVKTTEAVKSLAQQFDVEMPVTEAVYGVLSGEVHPKDAVQRLMGRPLRAE